MLRRPLGAWHRLLFLFGDSVVSEGKILYLLFSARDGYGGFSATAGIEVRSLTASGGSCPALGYKTGAAHFVCRIIADC